MKEQPISTKSTDYATIKLTCRPNLLNSRPQRIGFYSKLEIPACIQGLTDFKLGARVSKIHDRISITHALVFIIFSGRPTLESRQAGEAFQHQALDDVRRPHAMRAARGAAAADAARSAPARRRASRAS